MKKIWKVKKHYETFLKKRKHHQVDLTQNMTLNAKKANLTQE